MEDRLDTLIDQAIKQRKTLILRPSDPNSIREWQENKVIVSFQEDREGRVELSIVVTGNTRQRDIDAVWAKIERCQRRLVEYQGLWADSHESNFIEDIFALHKVGGLSYKGIADMLNEYVRGAQEWLEEHPCEDVDGTPGFYEWVANECPMVWRYCRHWVKWSFVVDPNDVLRWINPGDPDEAEDPPISTARVRDKIRYRTEQQTAVRWTRTKKR